MGVIKLDTIDKLIRIPVELHKEILRYQEDNHIVRYTAALLELVRKGLKAK